VSFLIAHITQYYASNRLYRRRYWWVIKQVIWPWRPQRIAAWTELPQRGESKPRRQKHHSARWFRAAPCIRNPMPPLSL